MKKTITRSAVAAAVISLVALGTSLPAQAASTPLGYVALGDSYASGNGVDDPAPGGGACLQSKLAYPSLWSAQHTDFSLASFACSGASIDTVLGTGTPAEPAITAALNTSSLVTLTVGGNDVGFMSTLEGCAFAPESTCLDLISTTVAPAIEAVGPKLVNLYSKIRALAPAAEVQVVGYPHLFDETGTCAGLIDWSTPARHAMNLAADKLATVTESSAKAAGFSFKDSRTAYAGHGACSTAPWIAEASFQTPPTAWMHPTARGHRALAELVTAPKPKTTIPVDASATNTGTGINVELGQNIAITASGTATYGWEGQKGCAGKPSVEATGARTLNGVACEPKFDAWSQIPAAPIGTLIGRIGTGKWFVVGSNKEVVASETGELTLQINDSNHSDNEGKYEITLN